MKRLLIVSALALQCAAVWAQDIKLPTPNYLQPNKPVMQTLMQRHSVRSFDATRELTTQQVSDLCWAACGQCRDEQHITAPTAMNRQEIRLFVFTKQAVFEYHFKQNTLIHQVDGDYRKLVAGTDGRIQEFVLDAPVSLVAVMDMDKFGKNDQHAQMMTCVDAGIVTQNINLFCEAVGLATVPRATMDVAGIQQLLQLNERQIPVMNNPVGYAK